jgi:type II secretory pathway pseudopilin PulG
VIGRFRGSTLVEVTVSFTLLALIVAFVLTLLPSSLSANARAHQEQQARGLAEDTLEKARLRSFSSLVCPSTQAVASPAGMESYSIYLEVFAPPDEDVADVKGLRARVEWDSKRHHKLVVDHYVTRIPR